MAGNDLNVNLRFTGDSKDALAATKELERQLKASLKKINTELASTQKQMNASMTADPKFADQQGIISRMYVSHSAQAKTLVGNLSTLKDSMSRVNKEFKNTAVTWDGVTQHINAGNIGLSKLGIQADLVGRYFDHLSSRMLNAGKNMQWTGRQMMVGLTVPIVGGAAAAVKSFTDFQTVSLRTQKLLAGNFGTSVAVSQIKELTDQADKLSESFGRFSSKDVAGVQNLFASIGKGKDEIKTLTELTVQFDTLGNVNNLGQTAEFVRTLFQTLGGGKAAIEETRRQMALLNEIDDKTNINMDQLIESVPKLFPLLKQFGLNAAQTGALITGLTQSGFDAVESANALKAAFTKLPAAAAIISGQGFDLSTGSKSGGSAAARQLRMLVTIIKDFNASHPDNVISFFDKQGKMVNAGAQLTQVARAYGLMNDAQKREFVYAAFGSQQNNKLTAELQNLLQAMQPLTDKANDLGTAWNVAGKAAGDTEPYDRLTKELGTILGDSSTKMLGTIQKIKNTIRDLGKQIIPYVLPIIQKLSNIFTWFNNLSPSVKKFIGELAAGLAVIGPVVYVLGQLTIAASTLFKTFITKPTAALLKLKYSREALESLFKPTVLATNATEKFGGRVAELSAEQEVLATRLAQTSKELAIQTELLGAPAGNRIKGATGGTQAHSEESLEAAVAKGKLSENDIPQMSGEIPTIAYDVPHPKARAVREQMVELIGKADLSPKEQAKAIEMTKLAVKQAQENTSALGRELLTSGPTYIREVTDQIITASKIPDETGSLSVKQIGTDFKSKIRNIFTKSTKRAAESTVEQLAMNIGGVGPYPKARSYTQPDLLGGLGGGLVNPNTTIRFNDEAKKINTLNEQKKILREIDASYAKRVPAVEKERNILKEIDQNLRNKGISPHGGQGRLFNPASFDTMGQIMGRGRSAEAEREWQRGSERSILNSIMHGGSMRDTFGSKKTEQQAFNLISEEKPKIALKNKISNIIMGAISAVSPSALSRKAKAPAFANMMNIFGGMGGGTNKLTPEPKTGGLLAGIGGLGGLLKIGGITIAITAIITLLQSLSKHWKDIQKGITNGLDNLKKAFSNLLGVIIKPFEALFGASKKSDGSLKTQASQWKSFGAMLNGVFNAVATAINFLSSVLSPIMTILSGFVVVVRSVITAIGGLPAPIRAVVIALGAFILARQLGMFDSLTGKIGLFKGGITNAIPAIRAFASSLSFIQAAAGAAVIGLAAVMYFIGQATKKFNDGKNAAEAFYGSLNKKFGDDPNDFDGRSKKMKALSDHYDQLYAKVKALQKKATDPWAMPWDIASATNELNKVRGELEGVNSDWKGLKANEEQEVQNIALIGKQYHLTTKEVLDFAHAHNIDLTMDPSAVDKAWKDAQASADAAGAVNFDSNVDNPSEDNIDKVKQYIKDNLMSAVQDSIQKMVDNWKEAALKAFDGYAERRKKALEDEQKAAEKALEDRKKTLEDEEKAQEKNIDAQIRNIDDLEKAEEAKSNLEDYLARKRKLLDDRVLEQNNYTTQRDAAIYEGNSNQAKQLYYEHAKAVADSQDEEQNLDRDHKRDLAKAAHDADKQALEDKKQALQDQLQVLQDGIDKEKEALQTKYDNLKTSLDAELQLQKDNLQAKLDAITESIPKNKAAADSLQQQVLTTLGSYSDAYATTAAANSSAFGVGWNTAMVKAHDDLYAKAWWAGDDALHQFAAALGVDVSVLRSGGPPPPAPAPAAGPAAPIPAQGGYSGYVGAGSSGPYPGRAHVKHGGGSIGSINHSPADVPATLQTGEYVVQRRAVAKLGTDLLDTLNNPQNIPTFHDGGVVGNLGPALSDTFANKIYQPFMAGNLKFGGKTGYQEMLEIMRQRLPQTSFSGLLGNIPGRFAGMFAGLPLGTVELAEVMFGADPNAMITATTGGHHVNGSYHYKGQAIDVVGNYNSLWSTLLPLAQNSTLAELFMDKFGGWKNGTSIGPIGGHMDHLHAAIADAFRGGFLSTLAGNGGLPVTGGIADWIMSALGLTHTDQGWLQGMMKLAMAESGGDPHNVSKVPVGHEYATGLMQMLPSTFRAHMLPGHGDIMNPVDNTASSIGYIKGRYGTVYNTPLFKGGKYYGYHKGGLVEFANGGKTLADGVAMLHKGETVVNAPLTEKLEHQDLNNDLNLHLHFEGGFFGSNKELDKLVDTIEHRVLPKLNRGKGLEARTRSTVSSIVGSNK